MRSDRRCAADKGSFAGSFTSDSMPQPKAVHFMLIGVVVNTTNSVTYHQTMHTAGFRMLFLHLSSNCLGHVMCQQDYQPRFQEQGHAGKRICHNICC